MRTAINLIYNHAFLIYNKFIIPAFARNGKREGDEKRFGCVSNCDEIIILRESAGMRIIRSYSTALQTFWEGSELCLIPMTDAHLPLLDEWNIRREVLFWCKGDDILTQREEVRRTATLPEDLHVHPLCKRNSGGRLLDSR